MPAITQLVSQVQGPHQELAKVVGYWVEECIAVLAGRMATVWLLGVCPLPLEIH